MRYAHTAFVLALARVTTRAYGSLAPRYLRYAGRNHGMISLYAAITADDAYFEMTLITLKQ
jgi:hypothetical protein